jgi:hypothetical protein
MSATVESGEILGNLFSEFLLKIMSVYRCEVENVRDGRATVFFVDYGNRGVVRLEELRQVPLHLHVDLAAIPALAMEASLAGIQANQARYSLPSQLGQVQSS